MTLSPTRRAVALAIAAAVLLGTLVFLFVRSTAAGYKADARAVSLLRALRDLDSRWDVEGQRLADTLRPSASGANRAPAVARMLQELERESARSALAAELPAISSALAEKQAAFRALQQAHAATLERIRRAEEALAAIPGEAARARARDPAAAERAASVAASTEHLAAALRELEIENHAERARALEFGLATLRPAAAFDPALARAAGAAETAARELLATRDAEHAAWRRFAFVTTGARMDLAARNLERAIETALDEGDRWRIYLSAYAAALLIGVGYLVLRVIGAQAALREANLELERRVAERTRDLRQTLEQLKESEAQLVQTEKMSSLGQLVAGVAHEINTPLAYVKNSIAHTRDRMPELREVLAQTERLLAMLMQDSPEAGELEAAFAALQTRLAALAESHVLDDLDSLTHDGLHGIEQIAELMANLRDFSRLDRSKVASFNVNEGVRAALLIARPALRKVDIDRRLAEVPSITCSPSQVNQVILNLVTNAAQAVDKPRGRITVSTRPEGREHVAIEVADDGRGIPPENLQRIFDPFFTTKEVGKGTGLGLSIAFKIVSQHGGRIDVKSELGVGSVFTVVLPIEPPRELAPSEAPALEEAVA